MSIEKAKTEKQTIRTGKRAGMKDRATISITVNDSDRTVTTLWERVKKYHSRNKETAAETARRVLLKGLMAEIEDMTLLAEKAEKQEQERLQGRLFND